MGASCDVGNQCGVAGTALPFHVLGTGRLLFVGAAWRCQKRGQKTSSGRGGGILGRAQRRRLDGFLGLDNGPGRAVVGQSELSGGSVMRSLADETVVRVAPTQNRWVPYLERYRTGEWRDR